MVKLFSIKERYSQKIFSKEKFVEFRRQNVKVKKKEKCLIYTTYPIKKITGYFIVKEKLRLPIKKLWLKTRSYAGITKAEFMEYFRGCKEGTALIFQSVRKFINQLSLEEIKSFLREFKPPQSYYNLDEKIFNIILKKAGYKIPAILDF